MVARIATKGGMAVEVTVVALKWSTVRMRLERVIVGSVMSFVAWVIERAVLRAQRHEGSARGH